jgi:hypothetical protein
MALIFTTKTPSKLLQEIKDGIDGGSIITWEYDSDGDFTHTPSQWYQKAYLRPKLYLGELRFGIINIPGTKLLSVNYAVYHGRFIEMMLSHFDSEFTNAKATALKSEPDLFNIDKW